MKKKNVWPVIIIALTFGGIFFFQLQDKFRRKQFFESELNTIIVRVKSNWSGGRSYGYVTENGIVITLINSDSLNLKVKDSVVKEKNSWEFVAFRVEGYGEDYKFYRRYNLK